MEGKQKYYQANRQSPFFNELQDLIIKTKDVIKASYRFPVPKKALADFCLKHHIKKMSLFGSVLRDDFRPDSDIDVLVEFEPGYVPGFSIVSIEDELTRLLGRKVDMRTPGDLSRYFRDQVVREARVAYEQSGK
jgi:predicted nucleotidyltransferase